MPAAKPKPRRTPNKAQGKAQGKAQEKASARAQVVARPKADAKKTDAKKADAKVDAPTLNGIPLRRKSVWAIDTDSPQFHAARKRDAQALKQAGGDGSMQILDGLLNDKDVQKWWN
jgi:hypothetical protein